MTSTAVTRTPNRPPNPAAVKRPTVNGSGGATGPAESITKGGTTLAPGSTRSVPSPTTNNSKAQSSPPVTPASGRPTSSAATASAVVPKRTIEPEDDSLLRPIRRPAASSSAQQKAKQVDDCDAEDVEEDAKLSDDPPPSPPKLPAPTPPEAAFDPIAAQREGYIVRTMSAGVTLGTIAGQHFGGRISMLGAQAYRADLIARAGAPTEPIEEMLVEQFAMIHSQLHLTHRKAASATGWEASKIFLGCVARLSSESRRLALAIRSYRSGTPKSAVVVNQSGNGGGKQVVVVGRQKNTLKKNTKLGSKARKSRENKKPKSQPKSRCCRSA